MPFEDRRMPFFRMNISQVGVLLTLMIGSAAATSAQSLPATPQTPDLLGIYPGMPSAAAQAQLQKHSDSVYVQSTGTGFGMTIPDPKNRDQISVFLTQPPNDPPSVWMIQRAQAFDPGVSMSKDTLLAALRQKYGKETLMSDHGGGGQYYYWIFDQSGKLLATADPRIMGCSGNSFITNIRLGPDKTNAVLDLCYGSFLAVTAYLNMRDAQLLQAYSVELVNLPYAVKAATITMNANNDAAEKARQAELKKADQNKPTF
jgi:hypothetical protein